MDRFGSTIFLRLVIAGVLISYTLQEEQLNVHLEPKYIKVCEGESVTINCTYQPGGKYKVKLFYRPTPDLDCYSPTVRASEKWHINNGNNNTSTFNISSIKTDDRGWYFCKVTRDVPFLVIKCSDGIQVLVDGQISSIEAQDALWMIVNHAGEHDDLVLHKHANCSPEYPNQPDNQTDNQTQNPTTADLPTNLFYNTLQEERLNVHLEPKYIQVCEGESVTINCTYQPGGKYKVKLYYSLTPDLGCNSPTDRTSEKWRINTENNKTSTFNISSIKTDDSGWYFCKVKRDIPALEEKCSDGIQVLVDANISPEYPNQTDNQTQNPTTADLPTNFFCNTLQEERLNVHLEPTYIQVCEGESVTINCTVQPGGKYKVKLYYSPTPDLGCNSATDKIHEKWLINTENNDTWTTFNISSIKTDDSGWYFCKVTRDIPSLFQNCSDGIQVVVNSTCRIMACI